jgi:hypothetical protein
MDGVDDGIAAQTSSRSTSNERKKRPRRKKKRAFMEPFRMTGIRLRDDDRSKRLDAKLALLMAAASSSQSSSSQVITGASTSTSADGTISSLSSTDDDIGTVRGDNKPEGQGSSWNCFSTPQADDDEGIIHTFASSSSPSSLSWAMIKQGYDFVDQHGNHHSYHQSPQFNNNGPWTAATTFFGEHHQNHQQNQHHNAHMSSSMPPPQQRSGTSARMA